MPPPRKEFLHGACHLITFRTEEGLPFVPTEGINEILWGILARAQDLYPVKICAAVFQANHAHIVIVVENPEDVPLFVKMVKQESAHAINRLLGRRQRTVWHRGYHSPPILTLESILHYLAYTLLNPVKDRLCAGPDQFPGVSTWRFLRDRLQRRRCSRVFRDRLPVIPDPGRPYLADRKILDSLREGYRDLLLEPVAWSSLFERTRDMSEPDVIALVEQYVMNELEALRASWRQEGKSEPSKQHLGKRSMLRSWIPEKRSRQVLCLSSDSSLRKAYIKRYRALCARAVEAFQSWKRGLVVPYPCGLFAPGFPRLVNPLPQFGSPFE